MNAQSTFRRDYGGSQNEFVGQIAMAADGGFLIVGNTRSYGSGSIDAYLLRLDAEGDTLWTRVYGGANDDNATAVRALPDGGWIVAGNTSSYGAGMSDAFIMRLDASGDMSWCKTYGRASNDGANWIEVTSDGGYAIAGLSVPSSGTGVYLMRSTSAGDTLWSRTIKLVGGSFVSMNGYSLVQNGIGDFLAFGDANDLAVCYYYVEADGDVVATGKFEGLQNYVNRLHVINVSTGGYLVSGTTAGAALDAFVMRLDENLNPLWTRRYGGPQSERVGCVIETMDGGFAVLGRTWGFGGANSDAADVMLLKIDALGTLEWTRTYGDARHEEGEFMVQTSDGGFCIVGTVMNSSMNRDILLIRVDADGHVGCEEVSASLTSTPVSCYRSSQSRQVTIGSQLGVPAFDLAHGLTISDPCSGADNIGEPANGQPLVWQHADGVLQAIGTRSGGILTEFDSVGRVLRQWAAQMGSTTVPLSNRASGIYLVTYADADRWSAYRDYIR